MPKRYIVPDDRLVSDLGVVLVFPPGRRHLPQLAIDRAHILNHTLGTREPHCYYQPLAFDTVDIVDGCLQSRHFLLLPADLPVEDEVLLKGGGELEQPVSAEL